MYSSDPASLKYFPKQPFSAVRNYAAENSTKACGQAMCLRSKLLRLRKSATRRTLFFKTIDFRPTTHI